MLAQRAAWQAGGFAITRYGLLHTRILREFYDVRVIPPQRRDAHRWSMRVS
jgi:hypothetical protein